MKVTVSVGGRFHAFNLASELLKRNALERLITSYPKFVVEKFGIPKNKTTSHVLKEVIDRGWSKLPIFIRNSYNPQFLSSELFDLQASLTVPVSDIFVGFSSFSLHSFKKAKKLGAITLVERGNAHIVFQNEILREEYEKFGMKPVLSHPKIIEKELKEYEFADYISFPSNYVRKSFLEKGFKPEKLVQAEFGVNLADFYPNDKKDNIFRVIFVGGMTLRKGVHYLLKAFYELNLPNSELMLVGSMNEEMKPFFKKYQGRFNFLGHIPQKKLHNYYSQSSVFVLMSIDEGLAMVQHQAMACGLPIIATPHTGSENLITNGKEGFIVPIRNTEALKEKLVFLYENPDIRKEMGEAALKRVKEGFSWHDYGERVFFAYSKLISERSRK